MRFPFYKQIIWQVTARYKQKKINAALSHFDAVYSGQQPWQGEEITRSALCVVNRVAISGTHYFIKRFNQEEKQILRYFRQSKVRTEWQNMLFFHRLGIPAAEVLAYGETLHGMVSMSGIFITEEIKNTTDLVSLADNHSLLLKDKRWVKQVSHQLAEVTRTLHQHRFAHNDLKWRNILVDVKADYPQIYLIDCPSGMKWLWPFLNYRIIKDLACLDKRGKYNLSQTQRMAFYKDYAQCHKLTAAHKKQIYKIIKFFHNRE